MKIFHASAIIHPHIGKTQQVGRKNLPKKTLYILYCVLYNILTVIEVPILYNGKVCCL